MGKKKRIDPSVKAWLEHEIGFEEACLFETEGRLFDLRSAQGRYHNTGTLPRGVRDEYNESMAPDNR